MRSDDWLESDEASSLGIRWDPRTDLFTFSGGTSSIGQFNDDTKTAVASLLARPFDPLGLISPFILLARKILKQTFEENLGWKDKLTGEMLESWQRWLSYLPDLEKVTFPRSRALYVKHGDSCVWRCSCKYGSWSCSICTYPRWQQRKI